MPWPLKIPALQFFDWDYPPRHSQIGFLKYVDITNLRRVSYLGSIISYAFACVGNEMAGKLLREIQYRGKGRLERELLQATMTVEESGREDIQEKYSRLRTHLFWGIEREKRIIRSLMDLVPDKKTAGPLIAENLKMIEECGRECLNQFRKIYESGCRAKGIPPAVKSPDAQYAAWDKIIPVYNPEMKNFPGCFRNYRYFQDKLGDDFLDKYEGIRAAFSKRSLALKEGFNTIDGIKTMSAIFDAVQAALWSQGYETAAFHQASFKEFAGYFQLLKDAGVVDFKKKS